MLCLIFSGVKGAFQLKEAYSETITHLHSKEQAGDSVIEKGTKALHKFYLSQ